MVSNGCSPSRRIGRRESLNDQDHAVNKRRTKTVNKLLPDNLCFAPFDTGCRLQMALGVKREWKKRYDGSKDYPRPP